MGETNDKERLEALRKLYDPCVICPRRCGAERAAGELGECGVGAVPLVASYGPHYGEEPELVGRGGSGTIFFGGCNLKCIFCQNYDISHYRAGREVEPDKLADVMLGLERGGCENVNFVSPTHFTALLAGAIITAKDMGLRVPIVWNSGGYESAETVELLDGLVEVYMPDAKYGPAAPAGELSGAPDYFDRMREAVYEMHGQVGDLATDGRGVATRGLLVRHLVLPNGLSDSEPVLDFLAGELSKDTYVNIMGQYRPCYRYDEYAGLNRYPTYDELNAVKEYARKIGLHRGF
jgi:putative pyruvate formate lyase activating enzyme